MTESKTTERRDLISALEVLSSDMIRVANMLREFQHEHAAELMCVSDLVDEWCEALERKSK